MSNKEKYEKYNKDELQNLLDISFSYSDFLKKLDMAVNSSSMRLVHRIIEKYELNENKLILNRKNNPNYYLGQSNKRKTLDYYLVDGKLCSTHNLKNRLIKEGYKENKCENCGIDTWLGVPISLQLHHKDGKKENNTLSNLQLLCPNCHSLTDNYAGKSIKSKYINVCKVCGCEISCRATYCRLCFSKMRIETPIVSRDELKDFIKNKPFTQIGKIFNVSDNTVRKWCKKYNLPTKIRDIKQYSDNEWELI